ncbi:MAG: type II/IV secretion system protein [Candidatus Hydrogenedentes bacterium]|nr:type II/IV secretion system protein [Candidatus Hydrogenedentota bacterium]
MPDLKSFERFLVSSGVVAEDRLERARGEARKRGATLTEVVQQLGFATAEQVYQALASFCELRYVVPSKMTIPEEVSRKVPARFATHYGFVPIAESNGALVVAVSDPLNAQLLDDIRLVLKRRIEATVATPEEIDRTTKVLYGVGADTMEKILISEESQGLVVNLGETSMSADLGDENIDASIIKFTNELILEAINSDCTDIHIEPFEDQLRVRFRIDGILHQVPTPPSIRGFHAAIVSRIKIMANLNIAEKRLPQDGKILARFGDSQYDLRVSILPTPHGETVNIRILSRASMFLTLDQLGFLPEDLTKFESFITKPHGIILVTGPTGSGKTTTLYAALSKLNNLDRKIITIEDPIEYQLRGVTQMQVLPRIGFDFGMGLRSMLRHDPDIMLVGEIRDYETAEMAIRSSLTGHLVLSTLHTNDAAGAVTRLTDMEVEPFLIASTMIASMAQRLVRRVCRNCSAPCAPNPQVLREEFGVTPEQVQRGQFVKGEGCDACRHTGYRGRIAIYEMLPFTNEIKELTARRSSSIEVKRKALEQGMKTLRMSGWRRVYEGLSTIEEVLRVTADAETMGAIIETGDAAIPV